MRSDADTECLFIVRLMIPMSTGTRTLYDYKARNNLLGYRSNPARGVFIEHLRVDENHYAETFCLYTKT